MTKAIINALYPRRRDRHRSQLNVDLPEGLLDALKAHAMTRNATIKDTVANLIRDATGANWRRYDVYVGDLYLRALLAQTDDVVREIQAQAQDLQHKPMREYGLAMRFYRGAIELLDEENKLRYGEYEICVGKHVSICDVAASFKTEPWAVNLLAVIEMYEGLAYPGMMELAVKWAKQQLEDSLNRAALKRLACEPEVAGPHRSAECEGACVDEICF